MPKIKASWRRCSCGCLLVVLTMALGLAALGFISKRQLNRFAEGNFTHFEGGDEIFVEKPISDRSLLLGMTVEITAECQKDVIIVAKRAVVKSTIRGNLYFKGDSLTIESSAVIEGKLKVDAETLIINGGDVRGPIEGNPGTLVNRDPKTTH